MRIHVGRAFVASVLAYLLWLFVAVSTASGQQAFDACTRLAEQRQAQTWVCYEVEEVDPSDVVAGLNHFLPPLLNCMRERGFESEVDVDRLDGLRVIVVQEIVVIPMKAGKLVLGYFHEEERTIYLREYMPSRVDPYTVFVHELIHALTGKSDHDRLPYVQCAGF